VTPSRQRDGAPPGGGDGTGDPGRWADQAFLRNVQYATASNLAARQAIYVYQQPRIRIYEWALDLAELGGDETIIDVGCGNGGYLAALHRRGHGGTTIGLDFSPGMLESTRLTASDERRTQLVVQGDAAALPFSTGSADVVLAMHMLYHVPDRAKALEELRRVVHPRGRALLVLNGAAHLTELRALVREALVEAGRSPSAVSTERLDLDAGERLASRLFTVERHDSRAQLVVPEAKSVVAYVRSMNFVQTGGPDEDPLLRHVEARVLQRIAAEGAFRVTTATGCLVCR
jgi:ubiquinone/menaquinone biosynthesis C-methylase UbiE